MLDTIFLVVQLIALIMLLQWALRKETDDE